MAKPEKKKHILFLLFVPVLTLQYRKAVHIAYIKDIRM